MGNGDVGRIVHNRPREKGSGVFIGTKQGNTFLERARLVRQLCHFRGDGEMPGKDELE